MRRPLLLLLALLLTLPLLAGCFGAQGKPLEAGARSRLRSGLEDLDALSHEQLLARQAELEEEIERAGEPKDLALRDTLERNLLLAGYCWERRADSDPGAFDEALRYYSRLTGQGAAGCARAPSSQYSSVALMRVAQIGEYRAQQSRLKAEDVSATAAERQDALEIAKEQQDRARAALDRAGQFPVQADPATSQVRGPLVLLRDPPVGSLPLTEWQQADVLHEAHQRLDAYHRERLIYRIFEYFVRMCGGADKDSSYVLAIILLAVLAKLITTPLSAAQFRSMRAMQALQPEIKKLQEKYKDDKQQIARAQMDLFKQHKVNPASSCLPMLVQMPVLIWVYYGIRYFIFRFEGVPFLYLHSLANPDVIPISGMLWPGPLLLLYGVSMFFSQKLMSTPTATPEQQQQQKLMAFMMPVLLVVILKGLPAAFILYWFLQNLLMTGHQYYILRAQREATTPGGQPPAPAGAPEPPTASAGPPPKAMEKLSQGGKPRKKKKKRR